MILTRPPAADDRAFIVSGWSSSYRMSRNCTTPMALYAKQKHEEVIYYLDRCRVLVAHGETGVLFGFIAYDTDYVLYAYVAGPFRRRGIARRLFADAGIDPSQRFGYHCQTRSSWELRSKIPLAEFDPYRARYKEAEHVRRTAEAAG